MYESLCVFLCVLAVFGGYIALRLAARAVLSGMTRRSDRRESGCGGCPLADGCPEKRTVGGETSSEAKSDAERD